MQTFRSVSAAAAGVNTGSAVDASWTHTESGTTGDDDVISGIGRQSWHSVIDEVLSVCGEIGERVRIRLSVQ